MKKFLTALSLALLIASTAFAAVDKEKLKADKAAGAKGASLTEKEFAGVVSQVMGQDMEPAFQVAGIL